MPARCTAIIIGCALWLISIATSASAQTAAEWRAQQIAAGDKSDQIMAEARLHPGLLAQYVVLSHAYASDHSRAFRLIFGQYISWYLSFLGDYPDAVRSFSIAQPAQYDDHASPLTASSGYTARPAIDAIPELAKNYRIVLFNEAHNVALTRSLTVQLLSRLHQQGFNYFAAETLSRTDTALLSRGYPTHDSGFYTEEPIYAEMVHTALKLGFKVIAYEATADAATTDERETEQAKNLYTQVFEHDPQARLIVNAGYDHIVKSGTYLDGSSMAEHLYKLTGLPMLSIEQTMMYPRPSRSDDHPYYLAAMKELRPDVPIVFVNAAGKPWALRNGYDLSVFFPPEKLELGRPTWLSLGDLRHPYMVRADHCLERYPCLIEAYYSDEAADAIPADRMMLDLSPLLISASNVAVYDSRQSAPSGNLYLRPGKYQLTFTVNRDQVVHKEEIVVTPP